MRRTATYRIPGTARTGIISAHAENSPAWSTNIAARWDHLRACGEQQDRLLLYKSWDGSSPRMRRTDRQGPTASRRIRIISAHAENRYGAMYRLMIRKDHLRACGEQRLLLYLINWKGGSSPRMRRSGGKPARQIPMPRIISAHAENRIMKKAMFECCWDHLRACGEQYHEQRNCLFLRGSSPRMRRTVRVDFIPVALRRIISAHAENSPSCRSPNLRA